MKPCLVISVILSVLAMVLPAQAEYLQGTVLRIDRQQGEMEILPRPARQEGATGMQAETESAEAEKILIKAAWFPRCLAVGDQVYARGTFVTGSREGFVAEEVFPSRRRGSHDPTGVRSRFHRHRRQMMHHRGGGMHE